LCGITGNLHENRPDLFADFIDPCNKVNLLVAANIMAAFYKARGRVGVIEGFAAALAASIADDAMTYRLSYDIRNQALFDGSFRPIVAEIERALIGIVRTAVSRPDTYTPKMATWPMPCSTAWSALSCREA
jgi:hypothetical protein